MVPTRRYGTAAGGRTWGGAVRPVYLFPSACRRMTLVRLEPDTEPNRSVPEPDGPLASPARTQARDGPCAKGRR
ncbi:hypothetical protein GCM10010512_42880 [Streptomyces thermoviolaceus subsp. thermoviolaceus]|nr:hypothetical protein GCM10010512_42880 [Streptomyces thermoviolaceus subsp. thermoviolaceus]